MNLSELIPSIFKTEILGKFSEATGLQDKLIGITSAISNAPTLLKQRAAGLAVRYNTSSSDACADLLNYLSDVYTCPSMEEISDGDNKGIQISGDYADEFCASMFKILEVDATTFESGTTVASFEAADGKCVELKLYKTPDKETISDGWNMTIYGTGDGPEVGHIMYERKEDPEVSVAQLFFYGFDTDLTGSDFIETLAMIAESKCSDNNFLSSIMSLAASKGSITLDDVTMLADGLPQSDIIREVKYKISSLSSIDFNSAASIVLSVMKSGVGAVKADDSGYTPYDSPQFAHNILGLVFDILSSVLSVVLTAIFGAIGIIFSIIANLIKTIWNSFQANIIKTKPAVKRLSLTPVVNVPITPYITFNVADEDFTTCFGEEITNLLLEKGAVALALSDGQFASRSPGYIAVVPCIDEQGALSSVSVQVLLSAESQAEAMVATDYLGQRVNPSVFFQVAGDGTWAQVSTTFTSSRTYGRIPVDYDYVSKASENEELTVLGLNYASAISLLADGMREDSDTLLCFVDASVDAPINEDNAYDLLKELLKGSYTISTSANGPSSFLKLAAQLVLKDMYDGAQVPGEDDPYDFAKLLERVINPTYNRGEAFWRSVLSKYFSYRSDVSHNWEYAFVDFSITEIAEPAVTYPELAMSDIWTAVIILAAGAIAVTVAKIGISRWRKKRATANLAAKQKDFSDAEKAYQENPTSENAEKLYKANKKLTRAWNKAGRAGVSCYNGFATSGETSSLASAAAALDTTPGASANNGALYDFDPVLSVLKRVK